MRSPTKVGLLLAALAGLPAFPAYAQDADDATRAAARQLGTTGVQAYQSGDYPTAHEKLEKAYRVLKVPSLGLWSARALVKTGHLVEAQERYLEVTRLPTNSGDVAVQKQAVADAETELRALTPTIPSIVIQVEGANPEDLVLAIDGARNSAELIGEPRPTNPGKHVIEAWRGQERAASEVTLVTGDKKTVTLRFTAAGAPALPPPPGPEPAGTPLPTGPTATPPPPGSELSFSGSTTPPPPVQRVRNPARTVAWIVFGAGAVTLTAGILSGSAASSKKDELDANPNCKDNKCLRSEKDAVDTYQAYRSISTATFIVGSGLAVAGFVMVLATSPTKERHVALELKPGYAGLSGVF